MLLKLPAVELRVIFSVDYDYILSSLANSAATLYATIKDKAATALAKHFHEAGPLRLVISIHNKRQKLSTDK